MENKDIKKQNKKAYDALRYANNKEYYKNRVRNKEKYSITGKVYGNRRYD